MATEVEAKPVVGPPATTGPEMANLLERIDRAEGGAKARLRQEAVERIDALVALARGGHEHALPALRLVLARRPDYFGKLGIADFAFKAMAMNASSSRDVFLRELLIRELEATRDEIAGPGASPLERILAERVAVCRFDAHERDVRHLEGLMGEEGLTPAASEYHSRMRDRATRRLLASCKALANVRRLAMPSLRVNIDARVAEAEPAPPVEGGGRKALPRG